MTTHIDVGGPPEEVMLERFDRSRIRLYARCLALRDSVAETVVGYVCDFELVGSAMLEDAQAAHRRASFLAQSVPRLLAASLDPRARLRQLVKLIVPAFAATSAMPEEDGYALLQRVRRLPGPLAQVPAIAVTAYARAEDAQRARRAGFYCHVPKPTKPEILADAVTRAFRAA